MYDANTASHNHTCYICDLFTTYLGVTSHMECVELLLHLLDLIILVHLVRKKTRI